MPPAPQLQPDTLLAQAKRNVPLLTVAAHLGLDLRMGVQRSPFRDDDRNPSFSVYTAADGVQCFKDHGHPDHSGTAWDLIALARPGIAPREIRAMLLHLAGLKDDPAQKKPSRAALRHFTRRQEILREQGRQAALTVIPRPDPSPHWPDPIRTRYTEGYRHIRHDHAWQSRIAASRGWWDPFIEPLIQDGLLAAPLLPWSDDRRGIAFIVQRPEPVPRTAGRQLSLVPVGYHQRHTVQRADGARSTSWVFVPHVPRRTDRDPTPFQHFLLQHAATIHAYPFVLGNLRSPPLIVITEGQWDAATLRASAHPHLHHAAVFGIRGASGTDLFLAAYGDWIHAVKPIAWVVADNDAAGARWRQRPQPNRAKPPEPSFIDRLLAFGCTRVVTSWLTETRFGKDYNDYFRHVLPDPHHIAEWMRTLNLPTQEEA
jgi:hypothetical protein